VSIVAAANPPRRPLAAMTCRLLEPVLPSRLEADLGQWVSGIAGWEPALPVVPSAGDPQLRWRALVAAFIKTRPSKQPGADRCGLPRHAWLLRTWDQVLMLQPQMLRRQARRCGPSGEARARRRSGFSATPRVDLPDPEASIRCRPVAGEPCAVTTAI
jgi:hypothetical protein